MEKGHLTPEQTAALRDGLMSGEEAVAALKHIGECMPCAAVFAESYQGRALLELPPDFKPALFSALRGEERETGMRPARPSDGRRELFRYGFRVGIAASITLILLFSGTVNYGFSLGRSIHTDLSEVNKITENVRGFSDKLVEFKLTRYIKEEL